MTARNIVVLGSTGSIGVSTLDVIDRHPERFNCYGLSANTDVKTMLAQCAAHQPRFAVMADADAAQSLRAQIKSQHLITQVITGKDALDQLVGDADVDVVVSGIVGAAGLLSTLAAVKAGKVVLIANKEPLVMLGEEIVKLAKNSGAKILPLDSEHNAIFQCLPQLGGDQSHVDLLGKGVSRLILTGSGGPFRTLPMAEFAHITPAQACAHPNWNMGKKISVDSATMMNKGLELIEACALFRLPADKIDIVIHPQSAIHSMVEYVDGSTLAQMANADMRVPIAHALGWPQRIESGVAPLDLTALAQLDFSAPDYARFPMLQLAATVAGVGGTQPTILSAANEVAVEGFLAGRISFLAMTDLVENTLQTLAASADRSLESVLEADAKARQITTVAMANLAA